jgi:chloramphenicol 3-O-phosphotransferase
MTDAEAYRFLCGHYHRHARDVHLLGAGEWSRAYAFVLDGREMVIRFGEHIEDFRKDQVMAAYRRAALPIPAVIEIGAAGDGYFAVSERAPGEPLDGLDGTGMQAALPVLWVSVRCEAAVAAGREIARGDRPIGMAASQVRMVHRGIAYDLQVDTTHTEALDCARAIAARV